MGYAEDPTHSCKAILHFMKNIIDDPDGKKRRALLEDLVWKAHSLKSEARTSFLSQANNLLNENNTSVLGEPSLYFLGQMDQQTDRAKFDVGIITILGPELRAVLTALGRPGDDAEDHSIGADRYWFSEIQRRGREPLSIVVTLVAQSRNVPCAIATDRLLNNFSVETLVLIGIAAGLKAKVTLCDVVCARTIIDYEHARQELKSPRLSTPKTRSGRGVKTEKIRPYHLNLASGLRNDLEIFSPNRFLELFRNNLKRLPQGTISPAIQRSIDKGTIKPEFHKGTLLAGEKLIADGSLVEKRIRFDDYVRGADQEDSGFAQACELRNPKIPWIVFRGISDYGDPGKGKQVQLVASLAAATVALLFLSESFRPGSDKPLILSTRSARAK